VLTELRAGIASALTAGGVKSVEYVGETITPPCAAVIPSDPYVEPGRPGTDTPFGFSNVAVDVLVVSGLMTAKSQASVMDDLIEKALAALDEGDFDVQSVSRPGVITLKGAKYLASVIRVEETKKL
jgi:hypothetical protein